MPDALDKQQSAALITPTRSGHSLHALIASWLGSFSESSDTRAAYARDLRDYLDWCVRRDLDPLSVRLPEVQMYGTELAASLNPRTGRPLAATTRARKLAAVSSWYTYLVRAGAIDANPARDAARPRYDRRHSTTASVSEAQATQMLAAAGTAQRGQLSAECASLVMALLVGLGIRVSELCHARLGDLGQREGMRVLTVRMKGGTVRTRPIPAQFSSLLESYLESRRAILRDLAAEGGQALALRDEMSTGDSSADDALLLTSQGKPVSRHQVFRLVRKLAAEAEVPDPDSITPHSLRHAFNTIARQRGAALEDRRDALGHSSAAITQLYDHVALSLARDPAHLVAAATSGLSD